MSKFSDAITTAAQLHQAETATYLTDAIIGVAFIIIILIVANLIVWQPGAHDSPMVLYFGCSHFVCELRSQLLYVDAPHLKSAVRQ